MCLPANAQNAKARSELVKDIMEWAVGAGEDFILMGDWNMEEEEGKTREFLATGALRSTDDANRGERERERGY